MKSGSFEIQGGNYDRAGAATDALKELLKKIGADSSAVRRATIAAYEAEMNVVIHAGHGTMRFRLNPGRLDLDVEDEGSGIPDIKLAMQEGYSTAPEQARKLGFGAGMGLPNIKKNSDRFEIDSIVGRGTHVKIVVVFQPRETVAVRPNALRVRADACRECLHCLEACPTKALRVRQGRPEILEHLCVECTACLAACRHGALTLESEDEAHVPAIISDSVLVAPPAFFMQFGADIGPLTVGQTLHKIGCERIYASETWEQALLRAVRNYAASAQYRPVIAPLCPVVINLVEVRFPSLIPYLAPFLSPMEAIRADLVAPALILAVACPSQSTAILAGPEKSGLGIVTVSALARAVFPLLGTSSFRKAGIASPPPYEERDLSDSQMPCAHVVRVTGLRDVLAILEELERGQLDDVDVLELAVCEQGCFGSPLFRETPEIARYRWTPGVLAPPDLSARALRRKAPYLARPGLRLDADMAKAIAKLAEIESLIRRLPGRDCGACGAPSCACLAEDIVLGRADLLHCVHLGRAASFSATDAG